MERIKLPDPRCASICRNRMNSLCLEACSEEGLGRHFELDPNLKLHDMPAPPDTDDMSLPIQLKIDKAYTKKMYEHLKGDLYVLPIIGRSHFDDTPSSEVSSAIPIQIVLHGIEKEAAVYQTGEELESSDIGLEGMA
jgi:hypothetical protein